jgi:hypothetical protein
MISCIRRDGRGGCLELKKIINFLQQKIYIRPELILALKQPFYSYQRNAVLKGGLGWHQKRTKKKIYEN